MHLGQAVTRVSLPGGRRRLQQIRLDALGGLVARQPVAGAAGRAAPVAGHLLEFEARHRRQGRPRFVVLALVPAQPAGILEGHGRVRRRPASARPRVRPPARPRASTSAAGLAEAPLVLVDQGQLAFGTDGDHQFGLGLLEHLHVQRGQLARRSRRRRTRAGRGRSSARPPRTAGSMSRAFRIRMAPLTASRVRDAVVGEEDVEEGRAARPEQDLARPDRSAGPSPSQPVQALLGHVGLGLERRPPRRWRCSGSRPASRPVRATTLRSGGTDGEMGTSCGQRRVALHAGQAVPDRLAWSSRGRPSARRRISRRGESDLL